MKKNKKERIGNENKIDHFEQGQNSNIKLFFPYLRVQITGGLPVTQVPSSGASSSKSQPSFGEEN